MQCLGHILSISTMSVCVCQQNVSLLEAEEKTVEQLGIEDGCQILIEGQQQLHCQLLCWNSPCCEFACLLPTQRDDSLTGRLRSSNKYPTVRARTNHFKNSFIPYAVANYQ